MEELEKLKKRLETTEASIKSTKNKVADLKEELRDLVEKRNQLIKEYLGKNILVKEGQLITLYLGIREVEIICGRDSKYDEPVLLFGCTKIKISSVGITIEDTAEKLQQQSYSTCPRPSYLKKMSREVTLLEACNIVEKSAKEFMNNITEKIKCI